MKYGKGWIVLLLLAILTPLGIIAAGGAWGEWDLDGVKDHAGFVPEGMRATSKHSSEPPLAGYTVPGLDGGCVQQGFGTIITAVLGALVTALAAMVVARITRNGGLS
jgi:cobalt/nickel transport system permease protein